MAMSSLLGGSLPSTLGTSVSIHVGTGVHRRRVAVSAFANSSRCFVPLNPAGTRLLMNYGGDCRAP